MHATFEKIEPPAPPEHPAHKAARVIRELHIENITLIDGGFIFFREGVDCSSEIKRCSEEQITLCEQIMERSQRMDPTQWEPAAMIRLDVQETASNIATDGEVIASAIPEIGNFDHDKDA